MLGPAAIAFIGYERWCSPLYDDYAPEMASQLLAITVMMNVFSGIILLPNSLPGILWFHSLGRGLQFLVLLPLLLLYELAVVPRVRARAESKLKLLPVSLATRHAGKAAIVYFFASVMLLIYAFNR